MANAQPEVKVRNPQFFEDGDEGTVLLTEAASQTFLAGEPIKLVAGLVTVCANDDILLFGFALEDASGTTSAPIWVKRVTEESRLIFSLYDGVTTGDTGAIVGTLDFFVGKSYPLCKNAITANYGLAKWVLSVKAADAANKQIHFKIEDIVDVDGNRAKLGAYVIARKVRPTVIVLDDVATEADAVTVIDATNYGFYSLVGVSADVNSDPNGTTASFCSVDFSGTNITVKTWIIDAEGAVQVSTDISSVNLVISGFLRD